MVFKDIKGQDRAIEILKEYIKNSRLDGSYLFVGEEGLGKRQVALILAKAVNCLKDNLEPCNACASCLKIEKNQHPDIHLIDAGALESIKIEDIRQLQKEINLRPYEGRKKVFIVNNAHNLTSDAANALLKVLEEPPKDTLIILISARPELLFKTIVSRCKIIKFYPLKKSEVKEVLKKNYHIEDAEAHFLAYFSEGRIGLALKMKDEEIFKEKNRVIDEFIFHKNVAWQNCTPSADTKTMTQPMRNKIVLRNQLNILTAWFRDLYFIKIGMPYAELINFDRHDALLKSMNRYTFFELNDILDFIAESLLYTEQNVNVKLLLANLKAELWKKQSW